MSSFMPDVIVAQAVDKLHLKSPIDRKTLNDEVKAGLDPAKFNLGNYKKRLAGGDPWEGFFESRQSLKKLGKASA